jgi:hypothetical protein
MRIILGAMLAAGIAAPAFAFNDPDWPCESRKVVNLSIGQMWPGTPPEDLSAWRDDAVLADAVARLSARRTTMEEAAGVLDAVAQGPDGKARLVDLFMGVFATVDAERARIVNGIVRYALRQRALSEKIDADRVTLTRLEAETAADDFDALDRIEEMRDGLVWETRIYDERRQSLQYVCETPVLLEKRLFELSRLVQARLGDG